MTAGAEATGSFGPHERQEREIVDRARSGKPRRPERRSVVGTLVAVLLTFAWAVSQPAAADDQDPEFRPLSVEWPAELQITNVDERVQYIIGGSLADADEFPFMALIVVRDAADNLSFCGGTLIAGDVILTAAHCIDTAEAAVVVVGRTDAPIAEDPEVVTAIAAGVHPDYVATDGLQGDVGLLQLEAAVEAPVVALAHPQDAAFAQPGVTATVAGWGRVGPDEMPSDLLRKASMPVRTAAECSVVLDANGVPLYDDAVNICAGYAPDDGFEPTGACRGDSGGPLLVATDDSRGRIQVGIVSYGPISGCIELGRPVVYMRTWAYLPWIESIAGDLTDPPATTTTTTSTTTVPTDTTTTTIAATSTTTVPTDATTTTIAPAVISPIAAATTTTLAAASFSAPAQASNGGNGGNGGSLAATGASGRLTGDLLGWAVLVLALGRVAVLVARRPAIR